MLDTNESDREYEIGSFINRIEKEKKSGPQSKEPC